VNHRDFFISPLGRFRIFADPVIMSRSKIAWIIAGAILLFLLTLFLVRDAILGWGIQKASDKIRSRYKAELKVGAYEMSGLRTISLANLILVPEGGDTLINVHAVRCKLSWSGLIRMRPQFGFIELDTATISLVKKDSSDNFRFLLAKKSEAADTADSKVPSTIGYEERIGGILDLVFDWFGTEISVNRFSIRYTRGKVVEELLIPQLFLEAGQFKSSMVTTSGEGVSLWLAHGEFDTQNRKMQVSIGRSSEKAMALPFLDLLDGLKVSLDSVRFQLAETEGVHALNWTSSLELYGFMTRHWRLSEEEIHVPTVRLTMNGYADADSTGLLPGSRCQVGTVPLNLGLDVSRKPERRIRSRADFNLANAGDLFGSLPSGMFRSVRGIKARGGLRFEFMADVPLDRPEALQLECGMKPAGFRIDSYGAENFSRISQPFTFLAMDGERPVRSFSVGPDNPSFIPLEQISPSLRNAVLICEDPSFFQHAGFVAESFRESMATNLKQRRFARGGSTISMQLVKNVFLSRNKSISRKLEEIMIVWLMERSRLVSKERMFEVYLNIIEWGPNVYGIGEASRFYFDKSPAQLTLEESIFLASIVPSPKAFRYRFGSDGQLKPYLGGFYKQVAGRMVRKEMIPQELADGIQPSIRLSGPAALLVQPVDSIPVDSAAWLPELPVQN
jgi:hypothetical protein